MWSAPTTLSFPIARFQAAVAPAGMPLVGQVEQAPPAPPPMPVGYHCWWSRALGAQAELQVHGHAGRLVLAFPPAGGRFYDFDDNGMLEAAAPWLESGLLRLVCLDSPDAEGWGNAALPVARRAAQADAFDRAVVEEVVPWLRSEHGGDAALGVFGCSFGAHHAANLLFRHPDLFDWGLCLSDLYDLEPVLGGFDPAAYFHSPLHYLPNLSDAWYLDRLRKANLVIACGTGVDEQVQAEQAARLGEVLARLGLPVWVDHWGADVTHGWHWWKRMLAYFPGAMAGRA